MYDVELVYEPEVLDFIVDIAIEYKLGARCLRSITETIMMDVMYEIPSKKASKYVVTLDYAHSKLDKMSSHRLKIA
jgi:ATP-dependent Clp protease ATP-binding subunit ClpX